VGVELGTRPPIKAWMTWITYGEELEVWNHPWFGLKCLQPIVSRQPDRHLSRKHSHVLAEQNFFSNYISLILEHSRCSTQKRPLNQLWCTGGPWVWPIGNMPSSYFVEAMSNCSAQRSRVRTSSQCDYRLFCFFKIVFLIFWTM